MALTVGTARFVQQRRMGEIARGAQRRQASMFGQMQEQSRAAEAASQAKYQEMLGLAGETSGQRAADIGESAAQRSAAISQQQARLGMSGTTVGASLRGGVEREKQAELNRLSDQMMGTKLGIMGQQAAVGERFAGQRMAMMGQRAQAPDALAQMEMTRMGTAPQMERERRSWTNWMRATGQKVGFA